MTSIGIDLGQLGLASTASGLRLQLTSHAEIASPEEGFEIDPCGLTTTQRPWCRRGHNFHLSLGLIFDGDFTEASMETLSSAVSQQLGVAEQWHQLPLCPASVTHTLLNANKASIVVHLDHHNTKSAKRLLHKLEAGVPDHDRAPPPGVATMTLDSIHMTMQFSRAASRKRRKLEPSLSEAVTYNVDPKPRQEKTVSVCRRSKTSPVPEGATIEHADMLFEASRTSPEQVEEDETISKTNRKRSYSTGDLNADNKTATVHEDLLELFDAGLRLAIMPHPSRIAKGLRVVSNESFKHLADCFPALWSPGHLAAVSSRAVFLPTVSHALADICSIHARNPVLRSKLVELNRQATSSNHGPRHRGPEAEHGSLSSAQQSIASRLWETMQRTLSQRDGTSPLKPFSQSFEHEQDANIWTDSMGFGDHSAGDQEDIDDFLSDSDDSMLDEEPLTPEARAGHGASLLWNNSGASENHVPEFVEQHVAGHKRGLHVEQVQEDDEVLSLCDSVGSMAIDAIVDVASSPGPDGWLMPAEDVEEKKLLDAEMEMDELIPI